MLSWPRACLSLPPQDAREAPSALPPRVSPQGAGERHLPSLFLKSRETKAQVGSLGRGWKSPPPCAHLAGSPGTCRAAGVMSPP